mgnify:CR=1 FL=1
MIYVAKCVAKTLKMPTSGLEISDEQAARLDEVSLLRRIIQKGGMQMRLVTLEEDWHKHDSGVMIGFYAPQKRRKKTCRYAPQRPRTLPRLSRRQARRL